MGLGKFPRNSWGRFALPGEKCGFRGWIIRQIERVSFKASGGGGVDRQLVDVVMVILRSQPSTKEKL